MKDAEPCKRTKKETYFAKERDIVHRFFSASDQEGKIGILGFERALIQWAQWKLGEWRESQDSSWNYQNGNIRPKIYLTLRHSLLWND